MTEPKEIPASAPWLDELNRLLAATPDLGPAQWVDREKGLLRLITPRPHGQIVAAALGRNQPVMDHLGTWSGTPRLQILLAQTDFVPDGSPRITVRRGTVWIECGDDPEAALPATFEGWFKALTGRAFPIPGWGAELEPAERNLWLPPGARRSDVQGFPHALHMGLQGEYRLAAFDGYGSNSYAFYLTDVRPGLSLQQRLSFGGVYGNPERDSARVVEFVKALYELVDEFKVHLTHLEYTSNMGRDRARLVGSAGEWEGPVESLAQVASLAGEIAAGRMPERPAQGRTRIPP
jgi:hypothetical protein